MPQADHTGSSVFLSLGPSQNLSSGLETIRSCVICHGKRRSRGPREALTGPATWPHDVV